MSIKDEYADLFNNNFNCENELEQIEGRKIHIRYQQRNKKKGMTIIEGLDESIDLKLFLKDIKKNLCCAGTIKQDNEKNKLIVQFQGDHRDYIKQFLIDKHDYKDIIIHGG